MSNLSDEPGNSTVLPLNHCFLPLLAPHWNVMKTLSSPYFMAPTIYWKLHCPRDLAPSVRSGSTKGRLLLGLLHQGCSRLYTQGFSIVVTPFAICRSFCYDWCSTKSKRSTALSSLSSSKNHVHTLWHLFHDKLCEQWQWSTLFPRHEKQRHLGSVEHHLQVKCKLEFIKLQWSFHKGVHSKYWNEFWRSVTRRGWAAIQYIGLEGHLTRILAKPINVQVEWPSNIFTFCHRKNVCWQLLPLRCLS